MRYQTMLWTALLLITVASGWSQQLPANPTGLQPTQPGMMTPAAGLPPLQNPVSATPAPLPGIVPLPTSVAEHVIAARETLHVISWTPHQVIVNTVLTVNTDGTVDLPYAGRVTVTGMKISDLQATLAQIMLQRFPGALVYLMLEGEKLPPGSVISEPLTVDQKTQTIVPNVPLLTDLLLPGDQLYLHVWTGDLSHVEVSVTINDASTISLPPLGPVSTKNLTLLTLRDYLVKRYRYYYPRCSVDVILTGRGGQPLDPQTMLPPVIEEVPAWQKLPPEVTATEILTTLPRFGAGIFGQQATTTSGTGATVPLPPSSGLPLTSAPIPADYLIGPGDELGIRNWTGAVEHYNGQLMVTPDGKIYLPLIGEVAVGGQDLGQLSALLASRFSKFYRGSQTTLTVVAPRAVEVYVTGDATAPGKYVLSGTATVFTALYAAGGPSAIGSLRNIRLSRKGQPSKIIDLYDYLLTGERDQDEPLNPGDTVFIGPSAATVGVAGLVRRPSLYEITDGLTIAEALKMAAGLDPRGYAPNIEVWRVDQNTAWNVININLNGANGAQKSANGDKQGADFKLQSGDLVLVRPVLEKPSNTVEVIGAVRRPGTYQVGSGLDVATLLLRAEGLEENAYVNQGAIWRLTPNHDYKLLRFSVRQALSKQQPDNLALLPGDKLYIYSREDVIQPQDVSIAGAVALPGVVPWAEDMRVSDLLLQARGLLPGAYTARADLQRLTTDRRQEIIPVQRGKILSGDANADICLQAGDQLTVYTQLEVAVVSEVMISGAVQHPGVYERKDGMRISDLIYQAGGLLPGAACDIEYTKGRTAGASQVTHLQLAYQGGKFAIEPDLVLSDDDHVAIMSTGDFNTKPQTIIVEGMVARPGTYALMSTPEQPDTVYKVLQRAGMPLPNANPCGIVLYRTIESISVQSQVNDVGQVLKAFNRESVGTQPTLSTNDKANAVTGSVAKQFASVFSGSRGEAVVVIPPRSLNYDAWANAVPIEGQKLLATQGKEGDMPLMPGDTIVVPTLPTTVAVLGAVVRPGAVRYAGQLTPREYVDLAGGPAADAMLSRMVVVRANGSVVALAQAKEVGPGDVVVVPSDFMIRQLGGPNGLQRVLETMAAVATAFIINN
ncbi:MAG: SLBB domain-containing protein [Armatimonadota bacterium]